MKSQKRIRKANKRLLDLLLALPLLSLSLLPMLLIACLIRADSKGPAIFRQIRVGRNGKTFVCCKFRTMRTDAPPNRATSHFPDAVNYMTRMGRFLRRTSLDELPQLFHVLSGKMSLVGPRPLIPEEQTVHELRKQNGSIALRPGITGLAQIRGRDDLNDAQKAEWDGKYWEQFGFFTDLRILLFTPLHVLRGDGNACGKQKKETRKRAPRS